MASPSRSNETPVSTQPARVAKTGITTQHKRLSASTAAAIGALTTMPTITVGGGWDTMILYPTSVTLQVEAGQANKVYYTVDGSTPSAINGFEVPAAPGQIVLPYPELLKNAGTVSATNQQIQLFAAAATNVQALFEFW